LRDAGAPRVIATTHGHEAGWAMLPGARQLLRRIASSVDVLTYLGDYTRARLAAAVGAGNAAKLQRLAPGVDTDVFRPGLGAEVRAELGLADRPVVVCVSRLMPRKGQDILIRALPVIRRSVPEAALLLVGGGPYRSRLESIVADVGGKDSVVFTGTVPWPELPAYYGAGDVFAMPCRSRLGGADVEGLGIVYLEASACALPVIAGDSGGAPDAVRDGETGYLVNGRSVQDVADRVAAVLGDPGLGAALGESGRSWVQQEWSWPTQIRTLAALWSA
jgi:phosphatidylinositol alpha-1,6-mannosyltransferase